MPVTFIGRDSYSITLTMKDLRRYPGSLLALLGCLGGGQHHLSQLTKPNLELLRIVYTGGTAPERHHIGSREMYTVEEEDGGRVDLFELCLLPEDAGAVDIDDIVSWTVYDDFVGPE